MGYRIVVLDLDSTPTNRSKIITSRTREALMRAQEAESVVVLVSGRPTAGVKLLAKEPELSHFGSCILPYNGGVITNCRAGETVFSSLLPRESNQKIIGLIEEHRVDVLTYEGGEIITSNEKHPYATAEFNTDRLSLRQVKDMKFYVDFRVPESLMLDDGNCLVTMEPKIGAAMERDFSVYRSEPYFLEIMPKEIDKAQSLARLSEVLGLEQEQMIACGDDYNDLTMIKYAGLDVTMEDTVLPVRQAADYIITSNNHDGVGVVVEKFILS